MPQITNLTATTELQAVNAMLSAIGEAPVTTLSPSPSADVDMALNILRDVTRDVQSWGGWRFNTEFGLEIAPAGTYAWSGTNSTTATLNVFKPPTGLVAFQVTRIPSQQGYQYLDTTIRPSKKYVEGGVPVLIFYDRALNRDGWSDRSYIYIDATFLLDFEDCPESARRFFTVRAARMFAEEIAGSASLSRFKEKDEMAALRNLKRDQGEHDSHNIFRNHSVSRWLGGRPFGASGVHDNRSSPGHT